MTFCFPTRNEWKFLLLHILVRFDVIRAETRAWPFLEECSSISWLFQFAFPGVCNMNIFSCASFYLYIFFFSVRCLLWFTFKLGGLFFYCWALRFLVCLGTESFIRCGFANTFSQCVACFFIPLTVSFTEQQVFIIFKFSLSILSCHGLCLRCWI